jgi:hypothetical protein
MKRRAGVLPIAPAPFTAAGELDLPGKRGGR